MQGRKEASFGSSMAAPDPHIKHHCPSNVARGPGTRSYTHFFCKSLFVVLFLIALPLFPSQPPDFVTQTIFTKFWELIHLLFVGIAVSYGLFSRRNVDVNIDFHHTTLDDSHSYVSSMFHVSSVFDNGYENSCGFYDKNAYQSLNSRNRKAQSEFEEGKGISAVHQQNQPVVFNVENCMSSSHENNLVQAWNSQYFQGESMVVLAQSNYDLGEFIDYKPLGLPVRSLRSKARNPGTSESSNGSESGSSDKASSNFSVNGRSGDLGVSDVNKLNENLVSPSPMPWRPRTGRMEMRDNVEPGSATHPSHYTPPPLSINQTVQFDSVKSTTMRSSDVSSSYKTSSRLHTPSDLSPSHSISSDSANSNMGELGKDKSFSRSYPHTSPSQSPPMPVNGSSSSHAQHHSYSSFLQEGESSSFEDDLNNLSGSRINNSLGREDWGSTSLKFRGEEFRKDNSYRRSYLSASPSPPPTKDKSSVDGLHSRHYSYSHGSFSEDDVRRSFEDDMEDMSGSRRKHSLGRREYRVSSSLRVGEGDELKQINNITSNVLHSRHYSHGSLLERDVKKKKEDHLEELCGSGTKDLRGSKERGTSSLKWVSRPATIARSSSRGKSVRTIRGSRCNKGATDDGEMGERHIDESLQRSYEAGYTRKSHFTAGVHNLKKETSKQNLDHSYHVRKSGPLRKQDRGKQKCCDDCVVDSRENSEREDENFQVTSEEEMLVDMYSDAGHDSNEVDKKAGEFIAKFKEQIRLQKMATNTESVYSQ